MLNASLVIRNSYLYFVLMDKEIRYPLAKIRGVLIVVLFLCEGAYLIPLMFDSFCYFSSNFLYP